MIEINNLTRFSVDKRFFLGVAKKVLKGENKGMESLSIAFISPLEIQKLNKQYRKKNKPTDVLSFGTIGDQITEIVICPTVVKEDAKKHNTPFKKELTKILIHGILHTLGYDHEISKKEEERMFKKQDYYLAQLY